MSDLVGPEIDKFLAEIPYRLLEPPWNTSIAIDKGWKVCYTTESHFQIKIVYYLLNFFSFVIEINNICYIRHIFFTRVTCSPSSCMMPPISIFYC